MNTINILFVSDQDSYKTIWVNGEKHYDSSDSIMLEDILWMVSGAVSNCSGGCSAITVNTFSMNEASTSDIPDYVNDVDSLCDWYQEFTGEEIEKGW